MYYGEDFMMSVMFFLVFWSIVLSVANWFITKAMGMDEVYSIVSSFLVLVLGVFVGAIWPFLISLFIAFMISMSKKTSGNSTVEHHHYYNKDEQDGKD